MNQSTPSPRRLRRTAILIAAMLDAARRLRRRRPRGQLRRARRLLRRRPDHPQPDRTARLPQVRPQLRAPGGADHRPDAARPELQRRDDRRHDQPAEHRTRHQPAAVRLARRGNDAGLADDRRQRHRLLRSRPQLHHGQPVQHALQGQIRLRRQRPDRRTDRGDGAESRGGAAGHPQPARRRRKSSSSTTRRSSRRRASAAGRRCRSASATFPTCGRRRKN